MSGEDWLDRVRERYAKAKPEPEVINMDGVQRLLPDVPRLLACAEALAELVDLHARFFDEDEASPVWERAYRARRGEA